MEEKVIKPQPKQHKFLSSSATFALYGGAAGGGKSYALLLESLRFINYKEYRGVIFRAQYSMLKNPGSIWEEALGLFPLFGGVPKHTTLDFVFPSGAKISFRYLDRPATRFNYQGSAFAFIGWDESTHFDEDSFFYLNSRLRTTAKIVPYVRATCNPDPDSFLAKIIEWYLDSNGFPIEERSGIIRYFYRIDNVLYWGDSKEYLRDRFPEMAKIADPMSFTFVSANLDDNLILLKNNPDYKASLLSLHPVEKERLLKGNWKIKYEAGTIFDRSWFEITDEQFTIHDLEHATVIRFWDFAATEKEQAKSGTSYTVGCKMAKFSDNYYVILDIWFDQIKGGEVFNQVVATGKQDTNQCLICWEQEGGSSGKTLAETYREKLTQEGLRGEGVKPMGNKMTRALPFATAAKNNKIKLIRAGWNDQFLNACQEFDGTHKSLVNDIIDACDGAYAKLETVNDFMLPMMVMEDSI